MLLSLESGVTASIRAALRPAPAAPGLPTLQSTKILDQLRERIRLLHYSRQTEQAYVRWCRAFIRFHGIRHPAEMGGPEVEAFLGWLAGERQVGVHGGFGARGGFEHSAPLGLQKGKLRHAAPPRRARAGCPPSSNSAVSSST